jgi:uncharacterized protein HemX
MDEKSKEIPQSSQSGDENGSSPWAAMVVTLVALMALCSAIYFVEIRQDELKAANALAETDTTQATGESPTSERSEKK